MSSKNFYESKLEQIKQLIKEEKFDKAHEEILAEINMPYIPMAYEKEFKDLFNFVRTKINKDDNRVFTLSREEVIELLLSESEESQAMALELIADQNLHHEKQSLKHRIETWKQSDIFKKAFLFELMIEQKIDVAIEFVKGLIINPAKQKSVLEAKQTLVMLQQINLLTEKEPTLTLATSQEAKRYLLLNYPNPPENGESLAQNIVNVVRHMFGQEVDLSGDELSIYKVLKTNNI